MIPLITVCVSWINDYKPSKPRQGLTIETVNWTYTSSSCLQALTDWKSCENMYLISMYPDLLTLEARIWNIYLDLNYTWNIYSIPFLIVVLGSWTEIEVYKVYRNYITIVCINRVITLSELFFIESAYGHLFVLPVTMKHVCMIV